MNFKDFQRELEMINEEIRAVESEYDMHDFDELMDRLEEWVGQSDNWSNDSRPAPQVHFRVNVSGLKRTPEATFTIDGDIRDVDMAAFWQQRDAFQREVDRRFPLETLAHFADLPPLDGHHGE